MKHIAHKTKEGKVQSLFDHLKNTAKITKQYTKELGLESLGELPALMHDTGKLRPSFQEYIRLSDQKAGGGKKLRHAVVGASVLQDLMSHAELCTLISAIIADHHVGVNDILNPEYKGGKNEVLDILGERLKYRDDEKDIPSKEDITGYFRAHGVDLEKLIQNATREYEFLCEKHNIGKKSEVEKRFFHYGLFRYLLSCLIDADRLDTAQFVTGITINNRQHTNKEALIDNFHENYRKLKAESEVSEINCIRNEISEEIAAFGAAKKGCYTVEVPTGGGKTLAVTSAVLEHIKKNNMERVFYVAPFTNIVDQSYKSIRKMLASDGNEITLHITDLCVSHSKTEGKLTELEKLTTESLDSFMVFTTLVQFLNMCYSSKTRHIRKFHNLSNSVIVFDEIQKLPPRWVCLFNNIVNFLVEFLGVSVILCTATQPVLHKEPIKAEFGQLKLAENYNIIKNPTQLCEKLKRVEIISKAGVFNKLSNEEISQLAANEVYDRRSCLVIVNTKRVAKGIYQEAKKVLPAEVAVYHLSTSMCQKHIENTLNEIKKCLRESKPILCVSTQLIEAGVDISFRSLIRSMAGIDSIAQAAGRCNRNGEEPVGKVILIDALEENLIKLTEIQKGKSITTSMLAQDYHESDLLKPEVVYAYYMNYLQEEKDLCYPLKGSSLTAIKGILHYGYGTVCSKVRPIETNTIPIITTYGDGKNIIRELERTTNPMYIRKLLRMAQLYTVNAYSHTIQDFLDNGYLRKVKEDLEVYVLDDIAYTLEYGLDKPKVESFIV